MCNLYRMSKPDAEASRLFSAAVGQEVNAGGDVYPVYPGLVIAGGELRSMIWGFPLVLKGEGPTAQAQTGQQHPRRQARQFHVALSRAILLCLG